MNNQRYNYVLSNQKCISIIFVCLFILYFEFTTSLILFSLANIHTEKMKEKFYQTIIITYMCKYSYNYQYVPKKIKQQTTVLTLRERSYDAIAVIVFRNCLQIRSLSGAL